MSEKHLRDVTLNDFAVDKDRETVDGFIPEVMESIGYGTETGTDPETGNIGLVPIPVKAEVGAHGQQREEDNPECYAQILRFRGHEEYVYYVRQNSRGEVSDPWGLYSEQGNARFARHRGRDEWSFRRVTEETFMYYAKYLATRNKAHLRQCERSILDA